MPTDIIEQSVNEKGSKLLFRVGLESGFCYLGLEADRRTATTRSVVIVDARRFYSRWSSVLRAMKREAWSQFNEYHLVGERFSMGSRNPLSVPKANPLRRPSPALQLLGMVARFFGWKSAGYRVSLMRGDNRVAWLIDHGATSFPVECETSMAPMLKRVAGVRGAPIVQVGVINAIPAIPLMVDASARSSTSTAQPQPGKVAVVRRHPSAA